MNRSTIIYFLASVIVLTGLFMLFRPQQKTSDTTVQTSYPAITEASKTKTFTLVVKSGKIVEGPQTLTATQGDMVIIKITLDEDNEFHLHGYDKSVGLKKDTQGELSFTADATGRFPYELEEGKIELGALEVQPK